jgi:hypothetical protein
MIVVAVLGALFGLIPNLMSTGGSGLLRIHAIIGWLPGAALWLWMAMANRAGKRWARITVTVLFGFGALGGISIWLVLAHEGAFSASAYPATTGRYLLVGLVSMLLDLTAIVLLWTRQSSDYYAAVSASRY